MTRDPVSFSCLGCGCDVSSLTGGCEYSYMLKHDLWCSIHGCLPWGGGLWCIGCLEEKLGRRLRRSDFLLSNGLTQLTGSQSDRLRDRLAVRSEVGARVYDASASSDSEKDSGTPDRGNARS